MKIEIKRNYWPSGKLCSEVPLKDGKTHGVVRFWDEKGNLWSEIPYKDGKRHGVVRWWHENGKFKEIRLWIKDIPEDIPIGVLIPLEPIM